ncbi:Sulfite exporter TauE/SafE [Phycisphaerae bacterium RAS1]|nr:Sulfite exporter TauE/SafE [Phycisphaerae bacterium RAS1]
MSALPTPIESGALHSAPRLEWSRLLRRRRVWAFAAGLGAALLVLGVVALVPHGGELRVPGSSLPLAATLVVFLAATICEFVDSSLGMGYGTTLTPLLLLAGFEPTAIVPAVLLSEGVTGLAATLMHQRDGNIDYLRDRRAGRVALLLAALSAVGAVGAVNIALLIPARSLAIIIALMIVGMGVLILGTIRRRLRFRPVHLVGVGMLAAFNKGLSGGGYGPLVTAGQVVSGVSPRQAVAITSLCESITCVAGLAGFLVMGKSILWELAGPMLVGALLSVPLATLSVRKLPESTIRGGVGIATLLLGGLALGRLAL